MYNEMFLRRIIREHGLEQAIMFCKIEGEKYEIMADEMDMGDAISVSEIVYERDWWKDRLKTLKTENDVRLNGEVS
jgi:hypothetical protein